MNKEQQTIFLLLTEIDKICRENRISYYLSPALTLRAVLGQPFPVNPLAGRILMKTPDLERFRQIFDQLKPEGRALESMYSQKSYPVFSMRYEDLNSTCYCLYRGGNIRYPGLGVEILPLRGGPVSEQKEKILELLETGWRATCYSYGFEWKLSEQMKGLFVRLLCLTGRERIGRKIFTLLVRARKTAKDGRYILRHGKQKENVFSEDIFRRTSEASLEGYSFLIPGKYKKYLTEMFGKNYARIPQEKYQTNYSVMVSAEVGCEEFLERAGSHKKLLNAWRRQYRLDVPGRHFREVYEGAWSHISLFGEGKELKLALKKKREYIRNLFACRDYVRLEEVFRPYTGLLRRCAAKEEFYELDGDLMEIYLTFLKETAREELARKIEQCREGGAGMES